MNEQSKKYTNDVCPHCEKEGTKHGVYLCESYGDYQSDKCKIICLTRENEQLLEALELLLGDSAVEGCDEYRKEKAHAAISKARGEV